MRRLSQIDIPRRFADVAPAWVIQAVVAILITIVAMLLRGLIEQGVAGVLPFSLMFPALLIATLVAGWPSGALTSVLGALAVWYFLYGPERGFKTLPANEAISIGLYLFSSSIVIAVAEAWRRSALALEVEQAQQSLLLNELNHRVKNTLATVQSIAAMTLGDGKSGPEAKIVFEGRLFALSRAHDILTRNAWESADLAEVVAQALTPFNQPGRIDMGGPPVQLNPHQVLGLSMALHELATNAAKYGALSTPTGKVRVSWTREAAELNFRWQELNGPTVSPPKSRGFGSRLLERALARELDGEVMLTFEPSGLACEVRTRVAEAA